MNADSSSDDDIFIASVYEYLLDDSSDDDVLLTRAAALNRDRAAAHQRLYNDYFADDCVYDQDAFKRRFRISRHIFQRICNALESRYPFFQQRSDARGRMGFSALQKCTAALRLMAYGTTADSVDEYLQMSERTARESMYQFSRAVIEVFGPVYLRKPNVHDVPKLYAAHEHRHGLPGMLGSLDCTHWKWERCPTAWKWQYTGWHGIPTLVLEAVASQDLWIWHAYFGVAGTNNDRNVLDQSPIFNDMFTGEAPDASFAVNGREYGFGYYLTDGIYPTYSTIVKAYRAPEGTREKDFTKRQESSRKDVERAFGVLKSKWHIVKNAARPYHLDNLKAIMYACIIMHNMVIEEAGDERGHICPYQPDAPQHPLYAPGTDAYMRRLLDIRDERLHSRLREDLASHVYYNRLNSYDEYEPEPVIVEENEGEVGEIDEVEDEDGEDGEYDADFDDYDDVADDDD